MSNLPTTLMVFISFIASLKTRAEKNLCRNLVCGLLISMTLLGLLEIFMQVCSFEWPVEESYADAGVIIVALYLILDMGILLTPVSLRQFVTYLGDFFFH